MIYNSDKILSRFVYVYGHFACISAIELKPYFSINKKFWKKIQNLWNFSWRKATRSHIWEGDILTLYWPVERVNSVMHTALCVCHVCLCNTLTWFDQSQTKAMTECKLGSFSVAKSAFSIYIFLDCGELSLAFCGCTYRGQKSILLIFLYSFRFIFWDGVFHWA